MEPKDLIRGMVYLGKESGGGGGGTKDYNQLSNKPKFNGRTIEGNKTSADYGIATKVSELVNDAGYQTEEEVKAAIDREVAAAYKFKGSVETYDDLPTEGLSMGDVYDVIETGVNYGWTGTKWDELGPFVDMSDYYNKTETDDLLDEKADASNVYTKVETDELLEDSQEVLVAVYEQTSYAEVKAAIDAHKAIVLDMPANNNQFCMTFSTYTNGGNALMYAIYKMGDRSTLMTVTLTPENNWTVTHTDLQDRLVSGTNIKTINNTSLLGSGNIAINEVFIAKQGETTASELKAAYAENKVILIVPSGTVYTSWSWVVCGFENNNSTTCELACIFLNGMNLSNGLSIIKFIVNGSNWTFTSQGVQNKLISGTNIKTINNQSLLGSGNIDVSGGGDGINFEVGAEKWYGTYTENNVTYQVYSKIVKIDALPSTAGITNYPHGITGIKQILSAYGFTTDGFVLNAPRQNIQDNIAIYQVSKNDTTGSIAIEVGKDRSSKQAYVCLIYAKNN